MSIAGEHRRHLLAVPIEGLVVKTALIDAGKIEGWMDAMPMEYPVKPDAEFQKLHVGDHLEGTVVVGDPAYYVTDVKVTPKK